MYNKVLTGLLVILITAIIGVLGYLGYGYYKKYKLNTDAEEYLEEFDTMVVKLAEEKDENNDNNNQQNTNQNTGMAGISTDKLVYKGFKVIGKLIMVCFLERINIFK